MPVSKSSVINNDIGNLAGYLSGYKDKFEGKTILITGAGGFLGKYISLLLKYLNTHVLHKPVKALLLDNFIIGTPEEDSVTDANLTYICHNVIEPFDTNLPVNYIIHAAGIASPLYYTQFPIETMDVTTIGTRNMLELARKKNVESFIFTSSSEVYGDPDPRFVPTPETYNGNVSIYGPRACYDESKRFAEILCLSYYRVFEVPIKIVRYFNIYGPGIRMNDYRVIPNCIERALRKEALLIHGDGRNTRAYCYINDAIEATFKLLFAVVKGEAFNIGNPEEEVSLNDLAHIIAGKFDYPVEIKYITPPHAVYGTSDPKRRCPDISKIQSVIEYNPRFTLENGLDRTIKWYQGNLASNQKIG